MSVIRIYSELYSGQTAQIIYYPTTGGTIDLGYQTLPYDYITEYYIGEYKLKFSGTDTVCTVVMILPSPTPTNTPTPTITPSITPTNTMTPTVTPTNTMTPTQTITSSPTPSVTMTMTNTPSETKPFIC